MKHKKLANIYSNPFVICRLFNYDLFSAGGLCSKSLRLVIIHVYELIPQCKSVYFKVSIWLTWITIGKKLPIQSNRLSDVRYKFLRFPGWRNLQCAVVMRFCRRHERGKQHRGYHLMRRCTSNNMRIYSCVYKIKDNVYAIREQGFVLFRSNISWFNNSIDSAV